MKVIAQIFLPTIKKTYVLSDEYVKIGHYRSTDHTKQKIERHIIKESYDIIHCARAKGPPIYVV